jgi:uncharacterized Tic20 family protein
MLSYEEKQARTWGMLCHLSALTGYFIPFGHLLGPLIIWLIKKDEYLFVDDQGKESLNFQLTLTLYTIISSILCILLIGFVLLLVLFLAELILVIIASVQANHGEKYRYPLTIRFIK